MSFLDKWKNRTKKPDGENAAPASTPPPPQPKSPSPDGVVNAGDFAGPQPTATATETPRATKNPEEPPVAPITNRQIAEMVQGIFQGIASDCPDEVLAKMPSVEMFETGYNMLGTEDALAEMEVVEITPGKKLFYSALFTIGLGVWGQTHAWKHRKSISPEERSARVRATAAAKREGYQAAMKTQEASNGS